MKLTELATSNLRGLPDSAHVFGERGAPPPGLLVVTGPPGVGTTTFLDAIAYTAARLSSAGIAPDPDEVLRAARSDASIRSSWWVADDERRYGGLAGEVAAAEVTFKRAGLGAVDADPGLLGLMSRYDHTGDTSKVVLFPARRVSDDARPAFSDFEASQRNMRLSPNAAKFAGLQIALAAKSRDPSVWDKAAKLFNELSHSARLTAVNSLGQIDFTTTAGTRIPLFRLSFSERNAFVFAASIALTGLDRAVILVDSPELGLPIGLAARWMSTLRGQTPDAQWIVASRDPDLVQSVSPTARVELVRGAP